MEKSILIVEDDADFAHMLQNRLSGLGYLVAARGDAAVTAKDVAAAEPDLIVLDLLLQGGNGLTVLERLRANAATKDIPVIILTGLGDDEVREQALRMGATAFIEKPFGSEQLAEEIEHALAA